jgi:hypothetical protein
MNQKRVCKSYPKEIKEEAVALVTELAYSVAQAAESWGQRFNGCVALTDSGQHSLKPFTNKAGQALDKR